MEEGKSAAVRLPQLGEHGYYEIRLESIGGLGANVCGKLLGELGAAYLGLNASSFSSYGSEKQGSPVKAHVRWAQGREILHNSPVERPQLLGLFHRALARSYPVMAGVEEGCTVVVNADASPDQMRRELRLRAGSIGCVDALALALQSKSRVNMVMLGALVRAAGFVPLDAAKALVRDTLGKKYPAMLPANLEGLELGYRELKTRHFPADGRYEYQPYQEMQSDWGYENAPLGGVNPLAGSTARNDLSASRQGFLPRFLPEKCIHCGLCDSSCPDMVFRFRPGEYRGMVTMLNHGPEYRYCKGCLRCVDICPTGALVSVREREQDTEGVAAGADPEITGESYLVEKRADGGLM